MTEMTVFEQKKLPFKNIKKQKILNSPVIARANLPAGRQAPGARRNLANSVASYGIATLINLIFLLIKKLNLLLAKTGEMVFEQKNYHLRNN